MFERILVPLDGSPRAELVLPQLARILRREDAEIVLFRSVWVPPADEWSDRRALLESGREEAQRYLHELARRVRAGGVKVHARVVEGGAVDSILQAADDEGATLIAMSTHGRRGLARWAMGSVAEKVVRSSRVPVLLVRSFRAGPGGDLEPVPAAELPFRRILVPTDGSAAAASVSGAATKFAQLSGSEMIVLHVLQPFAPPGPILAGMDAGVQFAPPPPPPPSDEDEATAGLARRFEQAGLRVRRVTKSGDPAVEIVDFEGADLVAMATHGRSGLGRWLLGSTAERVLRHSAAPLLLVRAEADAPKPAKKKAAKRKTTPRRR